MDTVIQKVEWCHKDASIPRNHEYAKVYGRGGLRLQTELGVLISRPSHRDIIPDDPARPSEIAQGKKETKRTRELAA